MFLTRHYRIALFALLVSVPFFSYAQDLTVSSLDSLVGKGEQKENKRHGEWNFYSKSNKHIVNANFYDGKLHGNIIVFDTVSGKKLTEGNYFKGEKFETWTSYFNDIVVLRVNYSWNEPNGKFVQYDSATGTRFLEGYFSGGKFDSVWAYYQSNGIHLEKKVKYYRGYLEGAAKYYDTISNTLTSKGEYKLGRKIGKWEYYFAKAGKLKGVENYENGRLDGESLLYDSATGNTIFRGQYKLGVPIGTWYRYYAANGNVREEFHFAKGKLDGACIGYNTQDKIETEGQYKAGKQDGKWKYYFPDNANLWITLEYGDDQLDGEAKCFYRSGDIKRKEKFSKGKWVSGTCYDEQGNVTDYYPIVSSEKFPGDVMTYIGSNLRYPKDNQEVDGRVLVGFTISESGRPTDIEILESVSEYCDAEAKRLIGNMPDWEPMVLDGVPLKTYKTLPIVFWRASSQ